MIAWLEPTQAEFLRAIALAADVAIAGAGSPSRGQTTTVAGMLNCPPIDDLRQALVEPRADLLLIFTLPDFDFAALAPTSIKIATLEPIPDSALAPVAGDWSPASTGPKATHVHFIPLLRNTPPFRAASEFLPSFGQIAALSYESLCLPEEGSLGSRLFAAMDLIHHLIGEPDTIDAAYIPIATPGSAGSLPGETLRGLSGTITANLRFPNQRSATLMLSNQGSRWSNTTTLLAGAPHTHDHQHDPDVPPPLRHVRGGRLRLFDDGFEWLAADGSKLDEMRPKRTRAGSPPRSRAAANSPASIALPAPANHAINAISDSLRRLLADTLFPEPPSDITTALALGQTALLSCRTGQPESPATIRRMIGAS